MTAGLKRHPGVSTTIAAERAVVLAGEALGLRVLDCEPVSWGRTGVFRVCLLNDADAMTSQTTSRFPSGHSAAAARHTRRGGAESSTHRIVHALSARGVRVAGPLHPEPVHIDGVGTGDGVVAFWPWLTAARPPADPLTAGEWGALTGHLHTRGTVQARRIPVPQVPIFDPLRSFTPRLLRAHQLAEQPGHPLSGQGVLLRSFEAALDDAADTARRAAAASPVVLVHGDNQPGNVLRTPEGISVLTDFERLVFGPAGVDWSALLLGRWHHGLTARDSLAFHAGYASAALPALRVPDHDTALANAEPFARLRELSGVLVSMLSAGDGARDSATDSADESGQWEREFHVRRHAIANPAYGPSWTFIGDPNGMHLSHEKRVR